MKRQRHQDGTLELLGRRRKMWYGHFYVSAAGADGQPRRKHVKVRVGPKSELTKGDAQDKLRSIIRKRCGLVPSLLGSELTLERFVRDRYIPLREGGWREESTAVTNNYLIESHILKKLGSYRLRELDKVVLQSHLNALAKKYSASIVKHVRVFLMSIFEEALDEDLVDKDPARKLYVPEVRRPDKSFLSWEQLADVLDALAPRDRIIVTLDMICALRPEELFALRRRSFLGDRLEIAETVYRGQLRPYAKTDASENTVYLPAGLAAEIKAWMAERPDDGPEAYLFPNTAGGFISKDNYLNRVLYPVRAKLKLPKLNFQILRRSFATLAQKEGSVKDAQRQLRHAKPTTTAVEYMQAIPESVQQMVSTMYDRLLAAEPASRRVQ